MGDDIRARVMPHPPGPFVPNTDDELFDWQKLRRYAAFSLGSVRRRPLLFSVVALGLIALAAAALVVLPKTYEVEARLLAQKNPVLAVKADSNPMDQPTRAAAETIIRRDNLKELIRQTELVQEWPKRRAPLLRLKDRAMRALGHEPTEGELTEGLTDLLQKNFTVWTTPDGAVAIKVHWPDALMAYRLVDAATQNFIERRHVLEVSTIAEQISILEGHAAKLKDGIEAQVADLQRLREASAPKGTHAALARPRPRPRSTDPEALNLRVLLEGKRRAIADLEESRRRHFVELQTKLSEQRAVYSENHPMLRELQSSIDSLRQESPQLAALKQEERELRRQLSERPDGGEGAVSGAPNIPPELFRAFSPDEDSSVEYARAQLQYAAQQYSGMRAKIDAARIDLDTARAAFKYRYSVIAPPQVPRGPIKPKALLVMAAAVIAGLVLALFATTLADFRAGVVLNSWQIEDLLGGMRPVIDVRLPWPSNGELPASEDHPPS